MKKIFIVLSLAFCMILSSSNCVKALDDASLGKLSVEGTKLVAENGEEIQLRGVSTHGLSWYPGYVNSSMIKSLHTKWNANVIRLAMYTAEYNGYCTGDSSNRTTLKKLIKKGVKYADANDMYVIIDWHILSDGNPNTYKKSAKAFFKWAAKTFKDYDNVIYEICNEPNSGTTWSDIKTYADYVIPTIRTYTDAVILVGTPTWSQDVDTISGDLLDYDNIMYTMHFYAGTHKSAYRKKLINAVEAGVPVFVSEFGISEASGNGTVNKTQGNKWINTMDKYNISYVCWNLSNKDEASALIKSSITQTSGIKRSNLTKSGKWFFDVLNSK